jgi:hypothetical protein
MICNRILSLFAFPLRVATSIGLNSTWATFPSLTHCQRVRLDCSTLKKAANVHSIRQKLQNPQCEGVFRGCLIFNGKAHFHFHLHRTPQTDRGLAKKVEIKVKELQSNRDHDDYLKPVDIYSPTASGHWKASTYRQPEERHMVGRLSTHVRCRYIPCSFTLTVVIGASVSITTSGCDDVNIYF